MALLACSAAGCGGTEPYDPSGDYTYLITKDDSTLTCYPVGDSSGTLQVYTEAGDSLRGTWSMCGGGMTNNLAEGHVRNGSFSFYMGGFVIRGAVLPMELLGLADGYGFTGLTFRAKRPHAGEGKSLP